MNKILKIFSYLFCNIIFNNCTPTIGAQNQTHLFDSFASDSWKSKKIEIESTQDTLEKHLVRKFNEYTSPQYELNTLKSTLKLIRDYCIDEVQFPSPRYFNHYQTFYNRDFDNFFSPRQWMIDLDIRELYRFKKFIHDLNLIDNGNYKNDCLVKARSLCGVFWEVDVSNPQSITAIRLFCGMLAPGQSFDSSEFEIYTCKHGFVEGFKRDGIEYYFVPYGIMADADSTNPNFVRKKGFRVIKMRTPDCGDFEDIQTAMHRNRTSADHQYAWDDYAAVKINNQSGNREDIQRITLKESLKDASIEGNKLNIVTEESSCLPEIDKICDNQEQEIGTYFSSERLFVIGFTSKPGMEMDESGLIISTAIGDNAVELIENPRRSLNDDENEKTPQRIDSRNNEYATSLATCEGMSGGPILKCKLRDADHQKTCELIGTLWGEERLFKEDGTIDRLVCFVNKKLF